MIMNHEWGAYTSLFEVKTLWLGRIFCWKSINEITFLLKLLLTVFILLCVMTEN